jgi:hypothetical protein
MVVTIYMILPISAAPERVFLGIKYIIGVERISLGVSILKMVELLKS